ncbi:MAG: chorismate synthase [Leptospirales bacterium]|nr:chorismate synthase [Leptospirales bacterium]
MSSISGTLFRVSTFGESHGPGVGVILDGCPPGFAINLDELQQELNRRKPGQSHLTTARQEPDSLEILSGVFEGKSLGTPIAMMVRNVDNRSQDYQSFAQIYRPSHADFTYHAKYGHRTPHGGGRASVRETIGRVAAGAIAKQILRNELGVETIAWVESVGTVDSQALKKPPQTRDQVDSNLIRCPNEIAAKKMIALVEEARSNKDSVGGTIGVIVRGVPPGLGDPVFDKLEAELAKASLSIPACKGFESGSGFEGTRLFGSQHNDEFIPAADPHKHGPTAELPAPVLETRTNMSGGIQGGISNGMPILCRLAFKPTATIAQALGSVNEKGESVTLEARGRHDPCVLPRAVPIVEAVFNLVLMDAYLRQRAAVPEWWIRYKRDREG